MKGHSSRGFTVIEVVLFLGITGLLAMMTFIGTGSSINVQRYRDSVMSLKSFLQQQYSDVANIENYHGSSDSACSGITAASRGQSDCVILGRYIANNGLNGLVVKNVVGIDNSIDASNIKDSLHNFNTSLSSVSSSDGDYKLTWGAELNKVSGPNFTTNFAVLIIRSPLSGAITTFISQENPSPSSNTLNPLEIVDISGSLTTPLKLCINSNGLFSGKKMMVYIAANSSSGNGVQLLGDGDAKNDCN